MAYPEAPKNCPFCDGSDIYLKYNGSRYGRYFYVECQTCGGRTRGVCMPNREIPTRKESGVDDFDNRYAVEAMNCWNRRV
jgi:hypothetical protein